MKNFRSALLGGLLLIGTAHAQQAPGEDDLYLKAMQSIADGRQEDASQILERMLAQGPRHAGEWLDLAMVQCALGHGVDAEQLFSRIEKEFAAPQGIRDIIDQQRKQGCYHWKAQTLWNISAARGYDSNVNQGASFPYYTDSNGTPIELLPAYKPHADHYNVLSADFLRDLNANGDLLFTQLHARQYQQESAYNSISLFAGAEHPWRAAYWQMRSSAMLGLLSLSGSLYQQQIQTQLRATPPLTLPTGYEFSLLGSLSYTSYKTLQHFNSTTSELRSVFGYRDNRTQLQATLGYQYDNGNSARPGGDRGGLSARLYGRHALGENLQGEFELVEQRWSGKSVYSPGIIDQLRQQNNLVLRTMLVYSLQREHSLQLEWRQARNRENISIFQYDSHQIQLSWRWSGL